MILHKLKQSNDFLNTILDNINSAIFILNSDFTIYDINNACKILLKKTSEDLKGKLLGNAINCIHALKNDGECGKNPECRECNLRQTITNTFKNKTVYSKVFMEREFIISKKRVKKILQYTARYFKFDNNEMVIVIVDDITAFEYQKSKLKELNEEKNKFIGYAVHDLRSPITVILMYVEYFMEFLSKNLDQKQIKSLNKINETAHFMLELTNDILNITKIDAGRLELNKEKGDYIKLIKENIDFNQMLAVKKDIKINFITSDEKILINFDKRRISEVINNLLSNAIKYSNPQTDITVKVTKNDNNILTEVIDQGPGIMQSEIKKLFKPFQKASVQTTAGESSNGLGLAISKKIVAAHKGEI
ncbi:MAG: PAS domain-containing sensor histidine kinase, partial [Spirochaetes bacterium]|nr:PAS domain-containing sensor histidine kinase [Spirochaetota bacterium]